MNYKESKKIYRAIKKSRNIVLNCHKNPDPDSIGSALALTQVLKGMKKKVTVICPTDLDDRLDYLPGYYDIKVVRFSEFDFSKYDLFITLDSGGWGLVAGDSEIDKPNIPLVVIDHHWSRSYSGDINLVDSEISSVGELLFLIFEDWKVKINKKIANALLTAIIGDTGSFRYPNTTYQTMLIAGELMKKGAEKNTINFHLHQTINENYIKFTSEFLRKIEVDKRNRFVWSAVSFNTYKRFSRPQDGKELATSIFTQSVSGTDFGIVMLETERGNLSISFRSRTDIDVSKLAQKIGGGGHKNAAGARIKGKNFEMAVKLVLREARKFAREHK